MKKIIGYHGSAFRGELNPQACSTCPGTQFTEGTGLYFSQNQSVAFGYGPFHYRLELDESACRMMRNEAEIEAALIEYLGLVWSAHEVLFQVEDYRLIASEMAGQLAQGDGAISDIPWRTRLVLDNRESFCAVDEAQQQEISNDLEDLFASMFPAYIFYNYGNASEEGIIRRLLDDRIRIIKIN